MNSEKVAFSVAARLRSAGKTVYVVNPRDPNCYKSLSSCPEATNIEAVNLIMSPKYSPQFVSEMKSLGIKNLFIQPGAASKEIFEIAKKDELDIKEGCVLIELP